MKAKNSEGKNLKGYVNPFLPLMPAPMAKRKEEQVFCVCGYCGGRDVLPEKKKPLRVNGIRIHPLHKQCIETVKRPLFDMDENKLQVHNH